MTEASTAEDLSLESLVARVADEFRERQGRGERPDVEEYAALHPAAASTLRRVLGSLQLLESLAGADAAAGDAALGALGDFRIVREIGRGGMGIVYEAEQISLHRRVALKVLPFAATMDPRHLQRFQNEARAAACLHHTNIVPVFAVGCERGVHFYAMQLIDGCTLADAIQGLRRPAKPPPPLSPRGRGEEEAGADVDVPTTAHVPADRVADPKVDTEPAVRQSTLGPAGGREYFRRVAQLGVQAAEALDHAHQVGIVHRDVKPGNLLLDGRGCVWVADFGLAHIQHGEANLTMTGDLMGTLRYMSPEQALAKRVPIDHRTDVYSLGATLYELLTLQPAFSGKDRQEVLRQIAFEEPKPPRRIAKAIPAELEVIVLKAMSKNPAERYGTAQEMADDLRRFLDDKPIRARRPSWRKVAIQWARRRRAAVTAAAVCLLLVLMVAASSVGWLMRDREIKRDDAVRRAGDALKSAEDYVGQENWPEGLRSVDQAEGFLAGFEEETALRLRARDLRRDLKMADRLQEARLRAAASADAHFELSAVDEAYAGAFRDYGLDVDQLDPQTAAAQIEARPIHRQLVAALDDWAFTRLYLPAEGWSRRLAVARAADPDGWRNRLRDAVERKDLTAMEEAAAADQADDFPPVTLQLVRTLQKGTPSADRLVVRLGRAQQRRPDDFWINEALGEILWKSGPSNLGEAIGFLRVAVALRPQSPGARLNLGNALCDKGDRDGGVAEYRKAIELNPKAAAPHTNLGVALHDKGDLDGAVAEWRKAIDLDPGLAVAHSNLGNALHDKGDLDGAVAECRKAVELDPKAAGAHTNLGVAMHDKGDLDGAVAEWRKAIDLDPGFAVAHTNLAAALGEKGDRDGAVAECRKAVELDPTVAMAHTNLAASLHNKGDLDGAVAEYRKATELDPKDAKARTFLAATLREKGDLDGAVAECRKMVDLDPRDASAHYKLGFVLYDKGDRDGGIAEYRKAIELDPGLAGAHSNLGFALHQKGDLDGAVAEYRKAIELDPKDAKAHSGLGAALGEKGDLDGAVAEYRKAIELQGNYAEAHNTLGLALGEKGDLDGAVAEHRKAVELDPKNALAQCNLGHVLCDQGRFAEALTHLRRGHELGSQNPHWAYPSAQWVRDAEMFLVLEPILPTVLRGQASPADASAALGFASLCQQPCKRLYAASVRFYADAFAEQPDLAEDVTSSHRYDAACCAALAGCGQGDDKPAPDEKERMHLRRQALDWLRAELKAQTAQTNSTIPVSRNNAIKALRHWREDADLAGVRGEAALAPLPEAEREEWRTLWADVEKTLAQAPDAAPEGKVKDKP